VNLGEHFTVAAGAAINILQRRRQTDCRFARRSQRSLVCQRFMDSFCGLALESVVRA
jgi:hypothetical protein